MSSYSDTQLMAFPSEASLVESFLNLIADDPTPWGEKLRIHTEFYYMRGRTDIVALSADGEVIAFEAKLQKWRTALHQAYRNTCFAHRSYVILPRDTAQYAFAKRHEFERRGIGICYLDGNQLIVLSEATRSEPLQRWLCEEVSELLLEEASGAA